MAAPKTVTTSANQRRTWGECQVKWGWRYMARIEAPKTDALLLGSAVHQALEIWYGGASPFEAVSKAREVVAKFGNPSRVPLLQAIAGGLIVGYTAFYKADREEWETLATEYHFVRPLARGIKDQGYIDLVIRERSTNEVWIVETKTRSRLHEDWITALPMDHQINGYVDELMSQPELVPTGVLYNVIRKPGIRPTQKESIPEFSRRLAVDIRARPDFYFVRSKVLVTDMGREEHRQIATVQSKDMRDAYAGKRPLVRTDGACLKDGRTCEFLALCARGMRPQTFDPAHDRVPVGFVSRGQREPTPEPEPVSIEE